MKEQGPFLRGMLHYCIVDSNFGNKTVNIFNTVNSMNKDAINTAISPNPSSCMLGRSPAFVLTSKLVSDASVER